MSNSCNQGNSLGCCLMNSFANAINNLFSTEPYCGCHHSHPTQNFTNGFVSGVNAANEVFGLGNDWGNGNNGGCGCNGGHNGNGGGNNVVILNGNGRNGNGTGNGGCGCGCGSNADLSAYTACGNQCYDAYYARQYALYPFNQGNGGCGCGGGYAF